jgi:hypothetical protein
VVKPAPERAASPLCSFKYPIPWARAVTSFARPSNIIAGFANLNFSILGKWLQTLKEVAPETKRVARADPHQQYRS